MSLHKLSVVIPSYNEAKNIKKGVLEKIDEYLKSQKFSYEIVIVDDGSSDDSINLIKQQIKNKPQIRLIENPHGGKAVTVMTGMIQSKGEIVLFTDMDQATPISEIEKFMPYFENQEFNIVIGSRSGRKGAPLIRKLTAWGFATLRTLILGLPFKDTQCGFKAFDRKAIDLIFPPMLAKWKKMHINGAAVNAGFDVEVLFIAKKNNLSIKEIPVNWHHVGTERVQIVKDAIEALKVLLQIRLNDIQKKY